MDWLRSEDLKEEKVLTTSKVTITRRGAIYLFRIDLMTVSVRHWSYAPQPGFRLKVRKCREFAWRAGEPWLGRQSMLRWPSGLLSEPNTQVEPFASGILCKIAHWMSPALGRDLCWCSGLWV